MQNFEKALDTKDDNEKYLTIVIIGGGPTGVEVAGALAELKRHALERDYPELNINHVKIILVEGEGKLIGTFSQGSSAKALRFLKKLQYVKHLNLELLPKKILFR